MRYRTVQSVQLIDVTDIAGLSIDNSSSEKSSDHISVCDISGLGKLLPMTYRHTLHSFWQIFRRSIKEADRLGRDGSEFFWFLPLKLEIPVGNISVSKKDYPAKLITYLFPFGACSVILQVSIDNYSLHIDEFVSLVLKLQGAEIPYPAPLQLDTFGPPQLENLSKSIVDKLNNGLFNNPQKIIPFPSIHRLVYVKKTNQPLEYSGMSVVKEDKRAFAYILSMKRVNRMDEDEINKILSCRFESEDNSEILLFYPACTFVYPSKKWIDELTDEVRVKADQSNEYDEERIRKMEESRILKSCDCMHDNYQSFLSTIFSSNRFIEECLIPNKSALPTKMMRDYVKIFSRVFPAPNNIDMSSSEKYYYKHAIEKVGNAIKLYNNIKVLQNSE